MSFYISLLTRLFKWNDKLSVLTFYLRKKALVKISKRFKFDFSLYITLAKDILRILNRSIQMLFLSHLWNLTITWTIAYLRLSVYLHNYYELSECIKMESGVVNKQWQLVDILQSLYHTAEQNKHYRFSVSFQFCDIHFQF